MDPALINQENLRKTGIGPIIRGMSLKTKLMQQLQRQNSVTANAVYCHRRGVSRVYLLLQKIGYENCINTARRTTSALRTSMRQTIPTTSTMTRTPTRVRCTTCEHALRARSLRHILMLGHMHLSIVIHERTPLSRFSPLLLPPVLSCFLLFFPPPALRAVL